nr:unnamed protein product [Digitaria exilis]
MEEQTVVLIVGAGPAGLATAACLTKLSIPYVIVEREDCSASLWRNRAYDRLKLHLGKEFCELPHMSYPADAPTYIPKDQFINLARNVATTSVARYTSRFLVVASGENSAANIPMIPGLHDFAGEVVHSSRHGIVTPKAGPLLLKAKTGRSAVIDVGTVLGNITKLNGNIVEFEGGKKRPFDAIVFATGYKSTANTWLKNGESMLSNDGLPKKGFPDHWKGANGLYCAGLARRGLAGIAFDAKNIANDILSSYRA